MGESARITSLEMVVRFLSILRQQQERAGEVLSGQQQEMHRVTEWFEQELPFLWKRELRRGYDRVSATRTAYETCRMRTTAGERPACFEEKQAYEKAKTRLRAAEAKMDDVQRWRTRYAQEAEECRGRLGKLQSYLDNDLERSIALLERMIVALENYLGRSLTDDADEPSSDSST